MANTKSNFAKSVNEGVVNHYGAIRTHITGSGNLKSTLFSLDYLKLFSILALTLKTRNNIEPTRLANFTQQRASLELRITEINEYFQVSKVLVFVKPVAKSYPSGKN